MGLPKYLDPARYKRALRQRRSLAQYDLDAARMERDRQFQSLGLDAATGELRLQEALTEMGVRPYDETDGTDSVHWLLFASLSLTERGQAFRDILEIGTFRAKTSHLLNILFPDARIVTCDLPQDDPIMQASYRRETDEQLQEYLQVRDGRVQRSGIKFVEANSFFLPQIEPGPYDLIWMDGGHRYPEVAWDMCNAWAMCKPGGIIMSDDIIPHPEGGDSYGRDEGHTVLQYLADRTDAEPAYLLKRLNPIWSADIVMRKFVSWFEKPLT